MRRVKVILPATVTLPISGNALSLALAMHTTVEVVERNDAQLIVETSGEGAGDVAIGLRHPVVYGMLRVFQQLERTVLGMTVRIDNRIPTRSGLGAEAAYQTAGVIAANNLLGMPYDRDHALHAAAEIAGGAARVVAAMRGGLTTALEDGETLVYRSLPVGANVRVVVALPVLESYADDVERVRLERAQMRDAVHNLNRLPLIIDALREGDLSTLARVLDDRLITPLYLPHLPGYNAVCGAARAAGAAAVTLSGRGPALVCLTDDANPRRVAEAVERAFRAADVTARVWIVPVDRQGVVLSVAQSSPT